MPTAIGGFPSARGGRPSRRRMSIAVTMRPRRLRTPAISGDDNGTRVSRSGMNTSWTRDMGRPNSWSPIMTVTYSMTLSLKVSLLMGAVRSSRRLVDFDVRFLERCDQPLAIELGHEIVEARLPSPLDRRRRGDRGQGDDRQPRAAQVRPQRLGEIEAVHARHLDVGDDEIELLPFLD